MDRISVLIFNTLSARQGLSLPGIGDLHVETEPAVMEQAGVVTPPKYRVVLADENSKGLPSVVKLVATVQGTDEEQAKEQYTEWLAAACTEEGVVIPSVGKVQDGVFVVASDLERALNPGVVSPVYLPDNVGVKRVVTWIVLAIVVGVGLSVVLILWIESRSQIQGVNRMLPEEVPAVVDTTSAMQQSVVNDTVADILSATPVRPVAADSVSKAPKPAAPSVQGKYKVIVGTYSTEANADKFIASAKQKNDTLHYEKLPRPNGRIMVVAYASDSEQEAQRMLRTLNEIFPGSWILKK